MGAGVTSAAGLGAGGLVGLGGDLLLLYRSMEPVLVKDSRDWLTKLTSGL